MIQINFKNYESLRNQIQFPQVICLNILHYEIIQSIVWVDLIFSKNTFKFYYLIFM